MRLPMDGSLAFAAKQFRDPTDSFFGPSPWGGPVGMPPRRMDGGRVITPEVQPYMPEANGGALPEVPFRPANAQGSPEDMRAALARLLGGNF